MKKNLKTPVTRLNFKAVLICVGVSLAAACVTVNVNFPESAVQKASDDYVRDLYRSKEQSKSTTPKTSPTPVGDSALLFVPSIHTGALNFLIPTAEAGEPSFNMNSPKLDAIKEKMKANIGEVIDQKKAGALGETNNGHLVLHDSSKLAPLLKKKIENLVDADNAQRENLYSEIVSSNHLAEDALVSVRKSFSRSFQAESPSGTWVQGVDGSWAQKR
jgi:uncharacterized protein YdbL (DUF1318 family)